MLDPAVGGEVLSELPIARGEDAPRGIDDEGGDTGGPGVDREDRRVSAFDHDATVA